MRNLISSFLPVTLSCRSSCLSGTCFSLSRRAQLALLAALTALTLSAQPIQYIESRKLFLLTTTTSSYAIGVDPNGELRHLYWGAPLWRADDVPGATPRR